MSYYIFAALIAYLLGSLTPAVWLGQLVFKRDVRKYGSKNPGASNSFYVYGIKGGALVAIIDIMKGFLALFIVHRLFGPQVSDLRVLLLLASFFAVLGHCKSIFLKFSGGKGLATLFGIYLYQFPILALIFLGVFIITVYITKYVSIGTFTVVTLFPVTQLVLNGRSFSAIAIFWMVLTTLFIYYRHRENVVRLAQGTEISIRTPRISEEELKK